MKDREPIRMAETLHELGIPLSGPEQFVAEGVSELAGEMVRWSVGPALDIDRNLLARNPARALSQVPVEDTNLRFTRKELARPSAETISLAVPLALAKAQAVEKEFHLTPKEKRAVSTFKSKARKAALGLAAFSLVATACTSEAKPTVSPTPFNTEPVSTEVSPTETSTTAPTPEILATATETFTPFTPPVNPPEFTPGGAGGEFPEGIREQAEIDRYRALLVLARQEGKTIFGTTDEEVKQQLNAFAEETNTEVEQEWNGKFGNEYQMVSVNIRTNPDGSQTVFWFATPGGALSARPDIPSEENSKLVGIDIPAGYHSEFRWGEDGNIYMFMVNDETGEAEKWFNTTSPPSGLIEYETSWEPLLLSLTAIENLAQRVNCSPCITEPYVDRDWGEESSITAVSSGKIYTIDLVDHQTGELVGKAEISPAVTKDKNGEPKVILIIVQAVFSENPDHNLLEVFLGHAAELAEVIEEYRFITEPQTKEFLEEVYAFGYIYEYSVATSLTIQRSGLPYDRLFDLLYQDPNYLNDLQTFARNQGVVELQEPILVLPYGMGAQPPK